MKVTVNFGSIRVIVPCGKGDFTVNRLMELAVTRYKKAAGKDIDIIVHNLKILSDGGILDPDDKLNDVADDREQIIATFQECNLPYLLHNGGDGTSASSIGTESPDIFQNEDFLTSDLKKHLYNGSDVEITSESISSGILPLHVRRGSEPALNKLSPLASTTPESSKRWSAAIMVDSDSIKNFKNEGENVHSEDELPPPGEREDGSGEEKSSPIQDVRREPLGGPITLPIISSQEIMKYMNPKVKICETVKLKNEDGPLGIHVVPETESSEKEFGLVIQGIEPGGRIDRDGRFKIGDKITEINGLSLDKESFQNTQEIFKDALKAPEISICCVKGDYTHNSQRKSPTFSCSKPISSSLKRETDSSDGFTEEEKGCFTPKSKLLTSTKKSMFSRSPSSAHSSLRKVGRRILIHLKKGSDGLGFSIVSKEVGANSYLFIKDILSCGAALDDGRLKIGDRILELNRIDMIGKNQLDVENILCNVSFGETVELVVSRPEEDNSPSPHLPRELPPEKANDGVGIFSWNKREIFTFDIPLNDTGSAGLGVSVKGKMSTNPNGAVDMGIFVKTVIYGGAASKDGRLRPNDQLLNINGISLLAMTNSQAMETLRRAMIQGDGPNASPHAITLTVARRISLSLLDDDSERAESSCHERSDSLLSESGDSFYVSNENLLSPPNKKINGVTPDTSISDNSANTVICLSKLQDNSVNINVDIENGTYDDCFPNGSDGNQMVKQFMNSEENQTLRTPNANHLFRKYNCNEEAQRSLTLMDVNPEECVSFFKSTPLKDDLIGYRDNFSSNKKLHLNTSSDFHSILPHTLRKANDLQKYQNEDMEQKNVRRQNIHEKKTVQDNLKYVEKGYQQKSSSFGTNDLVWSPNKQIPNERPVDVHSSEAFFKVLPSEQIQGTNRQAKSPVHHLSNSSDSLASINHQSCAQKDQVKTKVVVKVQRTPFFYPSCCWSCYSPGCPYHAVATTEKESPNSQPTSTHLGPTLGLCKSSSLESLQTMVHKLQKGDIALNKDGSRGCNESFRAAVDRSYDAPLIHPIESVQDPCDSGSSLMHRSIISKPHVRSATVGATADVIPGKKNAKSIKKKGLFKGLGSVFRFGKLNKKSAQESQIKKTEEPEYDSKQIEARRVALEERDRIQEQYYKLVQQEQLKQLNERNQSDHSRNLSNRKSHGSFCQSTSYQLLKASCSNQPSSLTHSRQERMHQLRADHQRRHQLRQGFYPQDNQEEIYEEQIKQIVDKKEICKRPLPPLPHQADIIPPQDIEYGAPNSRSRNFEIYKEMSKPGSRKGFVDPDRYSHYMNFQEIQQHLLQFQNQQNYLKDTKISEIMLRLQHEVPPDKRCTEKLPRHFRHTLSSPRSRPMSDNFELEYAQSCNSSSSRTRLKLGARSLPRQNFTSSRQRPPIPAYMRDQTSGEHTLNRECEFLPLYMDENSCYKRTFDVTSSKV